MDREKVIKGLECCTFILGKRKCNECPYQKGLPDNGCYQLQDDFHALLKDDETQLQYRDDHIAMYQAEVKRLEALLKEQEAIVRCKDCKHWYFADNRIPSERENVCGRNGTVVTPDWFCADGKQKEGR